MPSAHRRMLIVAGLLVFAGSHGCGSGSRLYPVSGNVTVDGAPMVAGSVALYPDASQGAQSWEIPGGKVRDGEYEIFTGPARGAPPGPYRVVVISTNFSGDKPPAPQGGTFEMPKSLINPQFSQPSTTPLAFEVVPTPTEGVYDLKVTR